LCPQISFHPKPRSVQGKNYDKTGGNLESQERAEGRSPAQALAEAQRELREQDKFKHPFYWAAFYMAGI